ncbi:lipopolysaccharide biosynthesis protein [Austwickia chelonae]|uniref:lipopolysaccharide biosynthesis protein n=1 Tax=Austwickia chelonae TaxID=100225 RepID=UPI0013C2C20F|nr:oligosaccharide flippase family protein [Austwickia chelonae]
MTTDDTDAGDRRKSDQEPPPDGTGAGGPRRGRATVVVRSAGWQLLAQLAPLVVNLTLTPYVITKLGVVAYGLFLIASTLTQFLGQFDGGIGRSATRYFAVYAGQGDSRAATRLLTSLLVCVVGLTSVTLGTVFVLAPKVVDFFHAPPALEQDTIFLIRVLTITVGVALARNLFAGVLNAHHRFRLTASTILLGYVVYAVGMLIVLEKGYGLWGVAWIFVAQQILATVTLVPSALPLLSADGVGFITRAELKEFFAFAWKVQLAGLLNMTGLQGATLIVGRMAPHDVPVFGPGSTFAYQLRMMPLNAIAPLQSVLGQSIGSRGAADTVGTFVRAQRIWAIAVGGWVAVGAPAAYFGVNVWLPLPGEEAGLVASLMLVAHLFALLPEPLGLWCMLLERPEFEMRAGAITVFLMLSLSALLVPAVGAVGVAAATIVAQMSSFAYRLLMVSRLPVPVPGPLRSVPWAWMVLAALLSFACVWGTTVLIERGVLPGRGLGLVLCGVAAAPAMATYVGATLGLRRAWQLIQRRGR